MILVLFLLPLCNFLPVSTIYFGKRFPEFMGAKNLSNFNADRSEAGSELNADHVQEAVATSEDPVIIETLPVGSGDATTIFCPQAEHKWISLIDMGSSMKSDGAMTRDNYVSYIDNLIGHGYKVKHIFLTHTDKDHLNYGYEKDQGILPLLIDHQPDEKVTIHLSSFSTWFGAFWDKNLFMRNFIFFLDENKDHFNLNYYGPTGENIIDICGTSNEEGIAPSQVTMKIIAADLGKTPNAKSMVMSLKHQGQRESRKMLFMGDFDGNEQYLLLMRNKEYRQHIPANVVMVPHHGSSTNGNGNPGFYDLVDASHAIVSSHIQNSKTTMRHPKLTTLAAICDGSDIIQQQEPYYPNYLCKVWKSEEQNQVIADCNKNMAQGYGTLNTLVSNVNNSVNFDKGMFHLYEDSDSRGCKTKIYQTTRIEDGLLKASIVETRLYHDDYPGVKYVPCFFCDSPNNQN